MSAHKQPPTHTLAGAPFVPMTLALARVAEQSPSSPALLTSGKVLCYQELWEQTGKIATLLETSGLQPGERIGLCFSKSKEWILAALGCWRAGMVIVPLDLCAPPERLNWYLHHASVAGVLGTGPIPTGISITHWLDTALAESSHSQNKPYPLHEKDPAYIVYTSSITGSPKGILGTHHTLTTTLQTLIEASQITETSRLLWTSSVLKLQSWLEIGLALLSGACLCIEADHLDPGLLPQSLERWRITHLHLSPFGLSQLQPEALPDTVRQLIISGPLPSASLTHTWSQRYPFLYVFGPPESGLCTAFLHITPANCQDLLLGLPLKGLHFCVLDSHQCPVPIGARGELWISGVGLALGYINNSRLTRASFQDIQGERYFRSGECVQPLPGPCYRLQGRTDRRLDWHDHSLEPEEIESPLRLHPQINQVAVFLQPDDQGKEQLTAAIQLKSQTMLHPSTLEQWLKSRLPVWMIPTRWLFCDTWPQKPGGETDLQSLQQKIPISLSGITPIAAVQEALILSIWRSILNNQTLTATQPLNAASHQWLEFLKRSHEQGLYFEAGVSARCQNSLALVRQLQHVHAKSINLEYLQKQTELGTSWEETLTRAEQRSGHAHTRGDIMLTGATGQIGRWLLRFLLEETRETIHCLVRASSTPAGLSRLIAIQSELGGWQTDWEKRLFIWCGDLEADQWAVTDAAWRRLSLSVNRIFHLAGHTQPTDPLEQHLRTDLKGIQTALKLQAAGRPKSLHVLSSLAIFAAHDRPNDLMLENGDLNQTGALYGGFAQSKWMVEYWLRQTRGRAGSLHIYRPGLLTGDSQYGQFSPYDVLQRMTRGLAYLASLPEDINPDQTLHITPADYVARAIFTLASHTEKQTGVHTWHLVNSHPLRFSSWLEALTQDRIKIDYLPRAEWYLYLQTTLQTIHKATDAAHLLTLCRLLREEQDTPAPGLDLFQTHRPHIDTRNADVILQREGVFCPSPTPDLLALYLNTIFPARL